MYLKTVKEFIILIILIINIFLLFSCDNWMKPMVPFIKDALSATVTFIHPDNVNENISVEAFINRKITRPNITKDGYMIRWYNDTSLTKEWKFNTDVVYGKQIILYGKWIISLNVGDPGPGGGSIFYVSSDGFTVQGINSGNSGKWPDSYTAYYLEIPTNLGAHPWASGDFSATIISGTSTALGTGRRNTAIILATDAAAPAALACINYGTHGDWFLPSRAELSLYYNSGVPGIPSGSVYYWTSSQASSTIAYAINFNTGAEVFNQEKSGTTTRVLPIRAF